MNLVEKYNVAVPRYTSYPPANFFGPFGADEYLKAVDQSNKDGARSLSFYIHMPFCKRLCHYCGCNSYIMPSKGETVNDYIDAIHREIDLVSAHLDNDRPISQIHFGGGSPTAMPVSVLKEINEHLLSLFPTIEKPEIAIECHPGYLSEQDWSNLANSYFTRFSLGVQDLDEKVLDAVGRVKPKLPLDEILPIIRQHGATVNLDFLFGLPFQTPESFAKNIEKAVELKPNRLVTFSYGHVPWVFKRQQILEKHGLPAPEIKQQMYDVAADMLIKAGYKAIGLDHFVLPDDELYQALQQGLLRRNFQGYCTSRYTGQVYAFGATGISQLDASYAQNTKDINEYIATVKNGQLPVAKGIDLTPAQRIVKEVIEQLMCNYQIRWSHLCQMLNLDVDSVKAALHYDQGQLDEMEADGLFTQSADGLVMTALGHPFVRNVAAALDPLMQHTGKQFSKPI